MSKSRQSGKLKVCCCAKNKEEEDAEEIDDCGSQFCLVEGTTTDHDQILLNRELTNKVWMWSRPPRGYSKTVPAVSARRVQVTQDMLKGDLDTGPKVPHPLPSSIEGSPVSKTLIRAGLSPKKRLNVTTASRT